MRTTAIRNSDQNIQYMIIQKNHRNTYRLRMACSCTQFANDVRIVKGVYIYTSDSKFRVQYKKHKKMYGLRMAFVLMDTVCQSRTVRVFQCVHVLCVCLYEGCTHTYFRNTMKSAHTACVYGLRRVYIHIQVIKNSEFKKHRNTYGLKMAFSCTHFKSDA